MGRSYCSQASTVYIPNYHKKRCLFTGLYRGLGSWLYSEQDPGLQCTFIANKQKIELPPNCSDPCLPWLPGGLDERTIYFKLNYCRESLTQIWLLYLFTFWPHATTFIANKRKIQSKEFFLRLFNYPPTMTIPCNLKS